MQAYSTFLKAICFGFTIFFQFSVNAQKLIPRIDEVVHLNEVTELAVSLDSKYFAIADADGIVTFRDVETGKVIASYDYDEQIEDIAFSDQEGCLIVISTDIGYDTTTAYVEHFDFINKKVLSFKEFENMEVYGADFSIEDNYALITPEEGKPLLINYKSGDTTLIPVKGDYSSASFGPNGTCIIFNGTEEDENKIVFEYHINSKKLLERRKINNALDDSDLNNKISYLIGDQIIFEDHLKNVSLSIPNVGYMESDGSTNIHDFAFSPDRKYLTVVGGKGTLETSMRTGYTIGEVEIETGYVALYDVETGKKLWKTKNQEYQPELDIKDVDWIGNESFIVGDSKGNIFSMSIAEEFYYNAFPLPRKVFTYASVSPDFSSIVYSQKGGPTYQFDIKDDGRREAISKRTSPRIHISINNIIAAISPSIELGKPVNNCVFGLHSVRNFPSDIHSDVNDMALSHSGKSFAISTSMRYTSRHSFNTKAIKGVQKNSDGQIAKIELEDYYLIPHNDAQRIDFESKLEDNPNVLKVETSVGTTIFDLENNSKPILIKGLIGSLQFSKNGNLLALLTDELENSAKIFDLENESWFRVPDEQYALKYIYFSQNQPYAISMNLYNETSVWNTETLEVLYKGRLEIDGFDPNSPIAETTNSLALQLDLFAENISFMADASKVYIQLQNESYLLDTKTGKLSQWGTSYDLINSSLSPDGKYLYTEEYDGENERTFSYLQNNSTYSFFYEKPFVECYDAEEEKILTGDVFFHNSKPLAFVHNAHGTFELLDLEKEVLLATVKFFENGEWIVFSPNGLFDGSKFGRNAIYYTYGTEVILFNQIKEKYWQPDLLNMLINNPGLILTEGTESGINMYPKANISVGTVAGEVNVSLSGPREEIGAVSMYINGKEVDSDINPSRSITLQMNVLEDKYRSYLYPEGNNEISVVTYNRSGSIQSRPYSVYFQSNLAKDKGEGGDNELVTTSRRRTRSSSSTKKPGLFGLFVGTSKYHNEKLNLDFADKDAHDLKEAFQMISAELYDQDRIFLKTLYSKSENPEELGSKQNILNEFEKIQKEAEPNDIIVLFFSGHGLTIDDDFYYLTKTAGKTDLRTDAEERTKTCLSSKEIKEGLRKIKSNKQIMILDACHSGQITKIFEGGDKATSTTLNKALENLEDKMGVYVLASSESNQKSFETETLQQGLLTFSLKFGMSGEASSDDILDVAELLTFASTNAEEIGKQILGKSQRPVLGITQGGNPFPVGTKNAELRVELPEKKIKFSAPNFFTLPLGTDPQKIKKAVKDQLVNRGAIGTNEDFIYIKNELDIDAIQIVGSYKLEGGKINLEWNLAKQEQVFKGPLKLSITESDTPIIGNLVINESLKALK